MADFTKILQAAEEGISQLAKTTFGNLGSQAATDGKAFLQAAKADLETFTKQLEAGEITLDEFKDLIQDQADLATMEALKQAGAAQASINTFVNGALSLVLTAALAAI